MDGAQLRLQLAGGCHNGAGEAGLLLRENGGIEELSETDSRRIWNDFDISAEINGRIAMPALCLLGAGLWSAAAVRHAGPLPPTTSLPVRLQCN